MSYGNETEIVVIIIISFVVVVVVVTTIAGVKMLNTNQV